MLAQLLKARGHLLILHVFEALLLFRQRIVDLQRLPEHRLLLVAVSAVFGGFIQYSN